MKARSRKNDKTLSTESKSRNRSYSVVRGRSRTASSGRAVSS